MKIRFLYCTLMLLSGFSRVFSQDIISGSPIVLPTATQNPYTVASGKTVHITSGVSIALNPGVSLFGGSTVFMAIDNNLKTPAPPVANAAADANRNWIMVHSYDESGNEIEASKQFYDNNGKPTQLQTKNETSGQVLASQTLYDLQGRGVLTTLAAPINNSAFAYSTNFVTAGGTPYSYLNFDGDPTNTANPYAKLNSPDVVDNTVQGTLGWYYSNSNSLEPMVGTTTLPYSRSDFYRDGTGATKRDAGIGQYLGMGSGHETTSNSFPVQHELDNYLAIRNQFFSTNAIGSVPTSMAGLALQSVSTDQNGTSALSVTDLTGKLSLMTARADASANPWLPVTNTLSLSNVLGQYVLYVNTNDNGTNFSGSSSGGTNGVYLPFNLTNLVINSANPVNVYCTDCQVPLAYTGAGNGYVFPEGGGGFNYMITSASPFDVTGYGGSTVFYDQVEATFQEPPTTAIQYFQLATPSAVNITASAGTYNLFNMGAATEPDITASVVNGSVNLQPGYYKVVANAPTTAGTTASTVNNVTVSYTNTYSDISYNYYNQLGQLVASIAPNGVQALINSMQNGVSSLTSLPFTTTYQYDLQGRLISTTSPDGGTSTFVYRQDGKIRFSQNAYQAKQANAGTGNIERFSYTNYDSFGRPIESGEYVVPGAAPVFSTLAGNTTLLEATGTNANVANCTKLNNINTYYDVPATNLSLAGYAQDPGFLKGAVSYTTNTVNGTVTSSTWHNYDDHGRVTWTVKQIAGLTTATTYKTINYAYDGTGNVTQVAYQQGAADQFIHYYTYDADGRLINVQTSLDGVNKQQQANYYYYLHGPLKRTELGDEVQGIDYTYTPQGWLKAINSPTNSTADDPGQDGLKNDFAPDAFGMQIEYFANDYASAGSSNIKPIPTGTKTYYNGNVSGISWHSNKTTSAVSNEPTGTDIQAPNMYTYTYDPKYQFTGATWGTPTFGSTPSFTPSAKNIFSETVTGYDANGNIMALQRTGASGGTTLTDNFTYNYNSQPNQPPTNNQLQSVSNAGGTSTGSLPNYGTYQYDEIGRLKSEVTTQMVQGKATSVPYFLQYDVTGKITGIYNDAAFASPIVTYAYDESGNRVSRTDYTATPTSPTSTTYYVYDASGNSMAIYHQYGSIAPNLTEVPVYGTGRLGTYYAGSRKTYVYELRDNVGSVRATVMGAKVSSNQANIYTYADYYPFGSIAQNGGGSYRYAYQGAYAQQDSVTGYNNFELRMYDARIGRWLSTDPAGQYASPYEGMGNDPVTGSDPTGAWHKDENGNLVADPGDGDDITRLATYLKIDETDAQSLYGNISNWDNGALQKTGLGDPAGHFLSANSLIGGGPVTIMSQLAYLNPTDQGTITAYDPYGPVNYNDLGLPTSSLAMTSQIVNTYSAVVGGLELKALFSAPAAFDAVKGGLNLYKWQSAASMAESGWKAGDYFLFFNNWSWEKNAAMLLEEMEKGKPIFDTFLNADGSIEETEGVLNQERELLKAHGWSFNQNIGAWVPYH